MDSARVQTVASFPPRQGREGLGLSLLQDRDGLCEWALTIVETALTWYQKEESESKSREYERQKWVFAMRNEREPR